MNTKIFCATGATGSPRGYPSFWQVERGLSQAAAARQAPWTRKGRGQLAAADLLRNETLRLPGRPALSIGCQQLRSPVAPTKQLSDRHPTQSVASETNDQKNKTLR